MGFDVVSFVSGFVGGIVGVLVAALFIFLGFIWRSDDAE